MVAVEAAYEPVQLESLHSRDNPHRPMITHTTESY